MQATSSSWFYAVSTISVSSGKWYAEFLTKSSTAMFVNIMESNKLPTVYPAAQSFAYAYYYNGQKWTNGSGSSYGDSYTNGDIIGVALDMDNGNVYFYKNGTVQNSGTAAFTGLSGDFVIGVSTSGTSGEWTANFGSDGSFNNRRGFGTNSDDKGIGQFVYAPPSGYLALCSANLSDPTIGPQASTQAGQHFNSKLWTGTGASADAKTGVGFKPDWLWAKDKNYANGHHLFDSSRGVDKYLSSDSSASETTNVGYALQSFDSDGFTTIGVGINYPSVSDYVAWLWHANGGTTSSNTEGTITSTVQANTTAGFSIIQYVGTGSALSYGHGLDERPTFYIVKDRDASNAWFIQYFDGSSDYYLAFSTASATSLSGFTPDATKMNYGGSSTLINTSSRNYIVYAFHSVPGYSKVGTYVGNSSTNGTYVYVGFRPAFVLIKNTGSGNWCLFDNKNTPINPVNLMMLADTAGTQSAGGTGDNLDFLSNGFKLRDNSGGRNTTGSTYLYLAFAEQPFKFSNAK